MPDVQLSPVVLVRAAGGSIDRMLGLELQETEQVLAELDRTEGSLEAEREALLDSLYAQIGATDPGERRALLVAARRRVLAGRSITGRLRDAAGGGVATYERLRREGATLRRRAARSWEREVEELEIELGRLARDEPFRLGLVLASPSLSRAIDRYLESSQSADAGQANADRAAREGAGGGGRRRRRLNLGVARYLSRFYAKTSPFSWFGRTGLAELPVSGSSEGERFEIEVDRRFGSVLLLNNALCGYLKEALVLRPEIRRRLPVVPGVIQRLANGTAIVALNTENRDRVVSVHRSELLDAILERVRERADRPPLLGDLAVDLVADGTVDGTPEEVATYLHSLVDNGVLGVGFSTPNLAPGWERRLAREIRARGLDELPEAAETVRLLDELADLKRRLAGARSPGVRLDLLEGACADLERLQARVGADRPAPSFRVGTLVYEDRIGRFAIRGLERGRLEPVVRELETLCRWAGDAGYLTAEHLQVREAFLGTYGPGRRVPLLEGWMEWVRTRTADDPDQPDEGAGPDRRPAFLDHLASACRQLVAGSTAVPEVVRLPLPEPPEGSLPGSRPRLSRAAFVQLCEDEADRLIAVLNFVAPGHGKMIARFLRHGEAAHRRLLAQNSAITGGLMLAELADRSVHSANVRPRIADRELPTAAGEARYGRRRRIDPGRLYVEWCDQASRLRLVDVDGREIVPFDGDFEVVQHRSSLYRFLASLPPSQNLSLSAAIAAIEREVEAVCRRPEPEPRVLSVPRIQLGAHLVVQRRTWLIPVELLELPAPGQSEWEYAHRLRRWSRRLGLPRHVFVSTLARGEWFGLDASWRRKVSIKEYKPQLLSFRNPDHVRLFAHLAKQTPRRMIVREMLPAIDQLPRLDGERTVVELVVEWDA